VKILAVSDQVVERVYSLASNGHFKDIDMILGCGDLPYTYLEYLVTVLKAPLFYVPGNHDPEYSPGDSRSRAEGGSNLDLVTVCHRNILIGGFGGSVRYRPDGINQYTQGESYLRAYRLASRLILNRIRYGRFLDVLISHSPPSGIHDDTDMPHHGLNAINWLIRLAHPRIHLHGHTHFYRSNIAESETRAGRTTVINVYPYKVIEYFSYDNLQKVSE
jgi:Icc-related predicted phosphoesterase